MSKKYRVYIGNHNLVGWFLVKYFTIVKGYFFDKDNWLIIDYWLPLVGYCQFKRGKLMMEEYK